MRQSLAAALAVALVLSACTQVRNPATGELQYTSLTPADEAKLGRQEHPKALREFGGKYDNARLQAYVEKVGNRIKNVSELSEQTFTFTVLDTDVVNAFALPGGYVYVTRGLVALTNNEAELAGVLGHEVGHVTARHTAQRYDQAEIGQIGAVAAQLGGAVLGGLLGGSEGARLGGEAGGQLGSTGAEAYVQGYSREQEFEADQLGIRYLGRAGYDPSAMATFLATLGADDAYRQRTQGGGTDEASYLGDWFRSHPRTPDRVARAVEATSGELPGARETNRPALLAAVDGTLYGEDPAQGVIEGTSFRHPGLRIAFEAPTGFRLQNSPEAVVGSDGRGRFMLFDMASGVRGDLRGYLQQGWLRNQRLQDLQLVQVTEGQAAVGFGQAGVGGQPVPAMFAVVAGDNDKVYRFVFGDQRGLDRSDIDAFDGSLRSLHRLSAAEAASIRGRRVEVVPVRQGDTVDTFVRQMQGVDDPRGLFVLLNGLDRGRTLQPGDQVKIVQYSASAPPVANRASPPRSA